MPGKIGYHNLYVESGVTVTASTEATGFEKENAFDWFGYDWWKPTATGDSWIRASFGAAKDADYMAIFGHDLSDHGSSIKAQYSTNGGTSWSDAFSAVTPTDNNTLFIDFTSVSAADWRIVVTNPTTIAAIAGVMIGQSLDLPHSMEIGFAPPSIVPDVDLRTAVSEKGVFLGGSQVSKGITGDFTLTYIDPAWIRSTWKPFIDHAITPKPFILSWDPDNYSSEAVLAWVTEKPRAPTYIDSLYMDLHLAFEGTL